MNKAVKRHLRLKKKIMGRFKIMGQRVLPLLLLVLLALSPALSAAAAAKPTAPAVPEGESFFTTMGQILLPVKDYLAGVETPAASLAEHEDKLNAAAASLSEYISTLLHDPALAAVLDEIIWDLVGSEQFREGIDDKLEFIAEIIRDERLAHTLGQVIAGFLQDPRLARDLEFMFTVIRDLLTDEDLHYFIQDTLATLLENPKLERTFNRLLAAILEESYHGTAGSLAALLADERVAAVLEESLVGLVSDLPDLAAHFVNNQELLAVTGDLLELMMGHSYEATVNLLSDPRFRSCLAEILVLILNEAPLAELGGDLAAYTLPKAAESITADTYNIGGGQRGNIFDKVLTSLVDEFVKRGEYQEYFTESLTYIMIEARDRARENTPRDETKISMFNETWQGLIAQLAGDAINNLRGMVAGSIAPVPSELIRDGFFNWLVYGDVQYNAELDPQPRTYRDWVLSLTGLLTPSRAEALSEALIAVFRSASGSFLAEHQDDINTALRGALSSPEPWNDVAQALLSNQDDLQAASQIVLTRIVINLPLDILAEQIRKELRGVNLEEISREIATAVPLAEAEAMLREDERALNVLHDALPNFALGKVAAIIRSDDSVVAALSDLINNFPAHKIALFFQNEQRASLIGETVAGILLDLAADFITHEQMAGFIQLAVMEMIGAVNQSPGTLLLDSLAAFVDNQDFAQYLDRAFSELSHGINRELIELYKLAVPGFFTRFIWRFI